MHITQYLQDSPLSSLYFCVAWNRRQFTGISTLTNAHGLLQIPFPKKTFYWSSTASALVCQTISVLHLNLSENSAHHGVALAWTGRHSISSFLVRMSDTAHWHFSVLSARKFFQDCQDLRNSDLKPRQAQEIWTYFIFRVVIENRLEWDSPAFLLDIRVPSGVQTAKPQPVTAPLWSRGGMKCVQIAHICTTLVDSCNSFQVK